ncbi:MAG: hypothetical protein ACO1O1_08760 [Adhaeribacter sp.]
MDQTNSLKITTDCGKEFELNQLEAIDSGNLSSNHNYTYTIYRAPTQEYIQKKSFFNPAMNHTSINYEIIPEQAFHQISTTLKKPDQ